MQAAASGIRRLYGADEPSVRGMLKYTKNVPENEEDEEETEIEESRTSGEKLQEFWLGDCLKWTHAFLILAIFVVDAMPGWLDEYVPTLIQYYLYPFAATIGFYTASCNTFSTFNHADICYQVFALLFALLSCLMTILFLLQHDVNTYADPDTLIPPETAFFNGTMSLTLWSNLSSGGQPLNVTTTSLTQTLPTWFTTEYVFAAIVCSVSILHAVMAFVILWMEIEWETSPLWFFITHNKIRNRDPEMERREKVYNNYRQNLWVSLTRSRNAPVIQYLFWVGIANFLVFALVPIVLSLVAFAQGYIIASPFRNVSFLFVYVCASSLYLPLPDLERSKYEAVVGDRQADTVEARIDKAYREEITGETMGDNDPGHRNAGVHLVFGLQRKRDQLFTVLLGFILVLQIAQLVVSAIVETNQHVYSSLSSPCDGLSTTNTTFIMHFARTVGVTSVTYTSALTTVMATIHRYTCFDWIYQFISLFATMLQFALIVDFLSIGSWEYQKLGRLLLNCKSDPSHCNNIVLENLNLGAFVRYAFHGSDSESQPSTRRKSTYRKS